MSFLDKSEREEMRFCYAEDEIIISNYKYNLILGGVVAYGLLVNAVLCSVIKDPTEIMSPFAFLIMYMVSCITGIFMAAKSDNPYISFAGYNLVVVPIGLLISGTVNAYSSINPEIVSAAFSITFVITLAMIILGSMYPEFFFSISGILSITLVGILIASIVCMIMGISDFVITVIGAALFSLYIGKDYARAQAYTKTVDNAIDSALDIYLDIINLFIRLLRILAEFSGSNGRRRR